MTTKPEESDQEIREALSVLAYGGFSPFADAEEPDYECKWHTNQIDAIKVSEMFPAVRFTVSGVGEEYDDVWSREYFGGRLCEKVTDDD